MSDGPGFPAGVGVWKLTRRDGEGDFVLARGHTAREAYDASGLRSLVPPVGFNELTFELVQDEAPPLPPEPAPVSPAIVRKVRRRRALGRMTGAERGATEAR
jgi:hypothetical protein